MIIRDAVPADAGVLVRLMAQLGHDSTAEDVRARLGIIGPPTLVVEVDGQVAGMCGLAASVHIHRDAPVGRITILIVDEAARGRGAGTALIDESLRRLALAGCTLIEVTSNDRLTQAHAFYEQRGFTHTSLRFAERI